MEIQYNSINARIYRWFYNVSDMPESLCPYFWKLLWLYIAIVPMLVISLPFQIYDKFDKQDNGERLIGGIVGYAILFFGSSMLSALFCLLFGFPHIDKDSVLSNFIGLGIALWFLWIIIGIIVGIVKIVDYKKRTYYYEYERENDYIARKYYYDKNHVKIYADEEQHSLIYIFIKAKYNRYCPKITWKKD